MLNFPLLILLRTSWRGGPPPPERIPELGSLGLRITPFPTGLGPGTRQAPRVGPVCPRLDRGLWSLPRAQAQCRVGAHAPRRWPKLAQGHPGEAWAPWLSWEEEGGRRKQTDGEGEGARDAGDACLPGWVRAQGAQQPRGRVSQRAAQSPRQRETACLGATEKPLIKTSLRATSWPPYKLK